MLDRIADKLDKIVLILIKATIFFLPLFFLPWTSEGLEFNKQFLLWLALPLALLLWLYQAALRGELKIKINLLNLPVLIFLALSAVAAIFSFDRYSSFFGQSGQFSDTWLGLASLVIFYFLIINSRVADSSEKIINLIKLFIYASVVSVIVSLVLILGGWGAILPSFNLASGSLLVFGIYLAINVVVLTGFLISDLKKIDRIIFIIGLIGSLIILALIKFYLGWLIVGLGAGFVILFRLKAGQEKNRAVILPAGLVVLAILMLALPKLDLAKLVLGRGLPHEAILSSGQAFSITKQTLKISPALGSGPGTFSQDFSLYRPAELNQALVWQVRFNMSSSDFLEKLATTGLVTRLSYFLIISLAVYLSLVLLNKHGLSPADHQLISVIFAVFVLIFIAQLLFFTTAVLNFMFWFYLALIIAFWQSRGQVLFKEKTINLRLYTRPVWLGLLVITAGWVALTTFEAKVYAAEIAAARELDKLANLAAAIKLNPYQSNYRIKLAQFYLGQARSEISRPAKERNNQLVQASIAEAIEIGRRAAELAPRSVLAQETLGMIYRDSRQVTLGSERWAVEAFSRAFALEPTNPVLAAELAKAYLNYNDLANAEKYFNKALELKSDYYEAEFGLAKVYLNNKKDSQALVLLTDLEQKVKSTEVYYELGRFYYNHGQIDQAIEKFKLVLGVSPGHSNSLYSLAVAYEAKGNLDEALKYYKQVLALNPGNVEVEKKVKELSK